MRLMTMRFKGFTWKDNPVSLRVENLRQVQETKIPYGDSQAEELGRQRRKVTGEGYFTGEGCMEDWNGLQAAFAQKGPGILQLPGVTPFWALMDSLELVGSQGQDLVRYTFSFTEWGAQPEFSGSGRYRAKAGQSLWDYANQWGIPVEELVARNPQIQDIGQLKEGEEVLVP